MHIIEFQDFSCYYKHKKDLIPALDGITLTVEQGEFLVVLGASGSGKTTMLKCILGLCDYIKGQLFIDGVAVDDLKLNKSNIGFVRQEPDLYPHLTVYENIAFPLRSGGASQEEVDRRVKELSELLEIRWLLTRKPKQLSGGQLQRVSIARALVKNPVVLLFDEPFSSIDPALRTELRQLIRKVHQVYQCTVLFVTHDQTDAYSLGQRVLVLEEGQIAAIGTPMELRQKGYLE